MLANKATQFILIEIVEKDKYKEHSTVEVC